MAKSTESHDKWQAYYKIKKETQKACHLAYINYVSSLANENCITKKLWSFIKSQRKDSCGVPPLKYNGTVYTDYHSKAKILNEYFCSVFTTSSSAGLPNLEGSPSPGIASLNVTTQVIAKLLKDLDIHKVTGPDNISAHQLKELNLELAPVLALIFQASLHQCRLPLDWKIANVVSIPIYKKGDHGSPCNYRPVSLTSICCKLLEHIIYSHIFSHLDQYNILHM